MCLTVQTGSRSSSHARVHERPHDCRAGSPGACSAAWAGPGALQPIPTRLAAQGLFPPWCMVLKGQSTDAYACAFLYTAQSPNTWQRLSIKGCQAPPLPPARQVPEALTADASWWKWLCALPATCAGDMRGKRSAELVLMSPTKVSLSGRGKRSLTFDIGEKKCRSADVARSGTARLQCHRAAQYAAIASDARHLCTLPHLNTTSPSLQVARVMPTPGTGGPTASGSSGHAATRFAAQPTNATTAMALPDLPLEILEIIGRSLELKDRQAAQL